MTRYFHLVTQFNGSFTKFELKHVIREKKNERANLLSKLNFLARGSLLKDTTATRKLKRNVSYYVIEGGDLYRRGFTATMLKCLSKEQHEYVLNDIEEYAECTPGHNQWPLEYSRPNITKQL
ncbi:hypothetical protein GmHk_16G046483 [Glycine max]|nr:hypothetical protein GmHk_16G046483 [Glycine max]